jgi:hypothetical protein
MKLIKYRGAPELNKTIVYRKGKQVKVAGLNKRFLMVSQKHFHSALNLQKK